MTQVKTVVEQGRKKFYVEYPKSLTKKQVKEILTAIKKDLKRDKN